MAPEKQVELLPAMIEAVNPPGQKPICRFALIGGGPSADFIRAATAGRDDVVMPGIVRGEDLAKCFASADLFFTPTVTGTMDLVFLESMASGLPVVGPRAVAVPPGGGQYRPSVPRLSERRKGLLREDKNVSHHAFDRDS